MHGLREDVHEVQPQPREDLLAGVPERSGAAQRGEAQDARQPLDRGTVDAYALRGRDGGAQAEPVGLPNLRAHTGKDGGGHDGFVHDRRDPACIHPDAVGRTGEALTPSADAEGRVRLRDAGMGVMEEGYTYSLTTGQPPAVGPVGFQRTLGSLAADGVQADGASVPVMAATPPAVSCDEPTPPDAYPAGAASPYDPRPDGPRYASMGDAVSVPVIEWIGLRLWCCIEQAELIGKDGELTDATV